MRLTSCGCWRTITNAFDQCIEMDGIPGMYLYSYREGLDYCSLVIVYDLFFIIQSLTTITLSRSSVGTFFLRVSIRLGSLKCIQKLSIRSVIFCFI